MDLLAEGSEDPLVREVTRQDRDLGKPGGERRNILGRGMKVDRKRGSHRQGGLLEVGDERDLPKDYS
jgi:hypothetical protein